MLRSRIILFSIAFFLSPGAIAANLDFNLSDEAFLVRYAKTTGGAQVDYGLLHQEDDVYIGSLGLHLVDNAGTQQRPVRVGLGGRLMLIDADAASGASLAIGAFGRFNLPGADRFAISGNIYFAPDVTSFADVDEYLEYGVRGEYEVLRNASLYLGYRKVEADFDVARGVDLDKGLHFGMNFTF